MSNAPCPAVLDIAMNIYWRLQDLAVEPQRWDFHVGYSPLFESAILRGRFQPAEWRMDRPDPPGLGRLIALVDEVRPRLPDRGIVREGSITFEIEGELRHIGHYPISSIAHMRPENIFWSRPNLVGGREVGGHTKGYVPIAELTPPSQGAVRQLAEHAIDACYRQLERTLREATDLPPQARLPPRRIIIFISHRVPRRDLAERVHQLLTESHAVFKPYLDRHDLAGGREWEEQLMTAIRTADLFIPIVTNDYGAGGMTKRELDEARRVAAERGMDNFIHPILLPDRAGEAGEQLQAIEGLSVQGIDELVPGQAWNDFCRRLLDASIRE